MGKLTDKQINEEIKKLEGWNYDGEKIRKKYNFEEYIKGIDFVNEIAKLAEEENHHPDILIGFREVEITLKSHDVDTITDRDINLASKIEKIDI